MVLDRDPLNDSPVNEQFETTERASQTFDAKKPFVEPVISVPADVLEATAFFQVPTFDTSDS